MPGPQAIELNKGTLAQISLGDILRLEPHPPEMPDLSQLDLTQSVFGGLSSMPFLLGDTRLTDVAPLEPPDPVTGAIYGIDWCGVFEAKNSPDCGAEYGVPGSPDKGMSASLLSLQIAGFHLDDLPTTTLPGGQSHANDLRTISYDQLDLDPERSLLPNVVISSVGGESPTLKNTTLGEAEVGLITPSKTAVVDCDDSTPGEFPCSSLPLPLPEGEHQPTLYDAQQAGVLREDALVGQLGHALDGFPVNALVLGLVGTPGDDPYDATPAELGITAENADVTTKTFGVWFSRIATGPGATTDPTITASLPAGFDYQPGSAVFHGTSGDVDLTPVIGSHVDSSMGETHVDLTFEIPGSVALSTDVLEIDFVGVPVNPHDPVDGESFERSRVVASISDGTFAQNVGSDTMVFSDSYENGDDIGGFQHQLFQDTLYFARLDARPAGASPDVDYFRIDPPNGSGRTMTLYLSGLSYDADLAVFHPQGAAGPNQPLRPAVGHADHHAAW